MLLVDKLLHLYCAKYKVLYWYTCTLLLFKLIFFSYLFSSQFLGVYIRHGNKYLDDDVDDRIKDSLQGIVRQLEGRLVEKNDTPKLDR